MNFGQNRNNEFHLTFEKLKFLTKFVGTISVIQSLIWIGFSVYAILSYYCVFTLHNVDINLGTMSIAGSTLYEIYFRGDCSREEFPNNNETSKFLDFLKEQTTLDATRVSYGVWAYLVLSVLWLMSSLSLIGLINEKHLRRTNILLYLWIFFTLLISILDFGFGVTFGLDYNEFKKKSDLLDFSNITNAAMLSSILMLVTSFRGFTLWILNIYSVIHLFVRTFSINEVAIPQIDNISNTHSISTHPPIKGYETNLNNTHQASVHVNSDPIKRAYNMSLESLKDRERQDGILNLGFSANDEFISKIATAPALPDPDYTPPMSRAFQNSSTDHQPAILRNKRFL